MIETANQFGHSGVLIKLPTYKIKKILPGIPEVLPRILQRGNKKGEITLITPLLISDEAPTDLIHDDGIARSADPELAQTRLNLRREAEESGRTAPVPDHHAQFIQNFLSAEAPESRALMRPGIDFGEIVVEEFGQSGDSVADNVVKQLPWQLPHPVTAISEKRADITCIFQIVGKMAFQVDGFPTEKSPFYQPAHFEHLECKLIVMACGNFQATGFSKLKQSVCFLRGDRKRLFQIDVASRTQDIARQESNDLGAA